MPNQLVFLGKTLPRFIHGEVLSRWVEDGDVGVQRIQHCPIENITLPFFLFGPFRR